MSSGYVEMIDRVIEILVNSGNQELAEQLMKQHSEFAANQCVHSSGIIGGDHGHPCCPVTGTGDARGGTTSATHITLHRIREKLLNGGPAASLALGDLLRVAYRQEVQRDAAKRHLYSKMCAWDNQDMPLEDWPEAILKALEGFGVAVEGCSPKVEVRRKLVSRRTHFARFINLTVTRVDREDDGSLTAYLEDMKDPEDMKAPDAEDSTPVDSATSQDSQVS